MKNLMFVFDRMPDQDGCTFIEVENEDGQSVNAGDWRLRADGLVELVIPVNYGHEFDEAKERELFEEWADEKGFCLDCKFFEKGNNFEYQATQWLFEAWLASAKSRSAP